MCFVFTAQYVGISVTHLCYNNKSVLMIPWYSNLVHLKQVLVSQATLHLSCCFCFFITFLSYYRKVPWNLLTITIRTIPLCVFLMLPCHGW